MTDEQLKLINGSYDFIHTGGYLAVGLTLFVVLSAVGFSRSRGIG